MPKPQHVPLKHIFYPLEERGEIINVALNPQWHQNIKASFRGTKGPFVSNIAEAADKNKQRGDEHRENHRFSKRVVESRKVRLQVLGTHIKKSTDMQVCLLNYDGLVNTEETDGQKTSKEQRYILQGTPVEGSFDNTCLKRHQKDCDTCRY